MQRRNLQRHQPEEAEEASDHLSDHSALPSSESEGEDLIDNAEADYQPIPVTLSTQRNLTSTRKKESMISTTKSILKTERLQKNSCIVMKMESNLLKALNSSYKRIHSIAN